MRPHPDPVDNIPDPYVIVQATSSTGSHSKQTPYNRETLNPTWNTVLNFGCRRWVPFIELQVWDKDEPRNDNDSMSTKQKLTLLPIPMGIIRITHTRPMAVVT